ncbi:MAG: ribosome biogenesis GTPase YlqF [Clostridia bacterium]|nr:ribosome biogenesis GTPase YlqF [Clostridia bacterium]
MNINWYPGHMAKTKKQIIEDLKLIDIVIEVLDARIPISSQNPDIQEQIKQKKKVIILNKSDLSDEKQNQKWVEYFAKQNIPAVLVDSTSGKGFNEVDKVIKNVYEAGRYEQKGRVGKSIRLMVMGIPNVGKSSFINRMAHKASTKVGNKPGVTKQKQWIRVSNEIELLDTPGVLWPKLDEKNTAMNLAYTGTIKDEILPTIEVGFALLKVLMEHYLKNLIERYKLSAEVIEAILQNRVLEPNEKALEVMNEIGRKRGCVIAGGEIDQERIANMLLEDFRTGKLGKITLEMSQ